MDEPMSEDNARDARFVAEKDAETGMTHVALVYVEALMGAAQSAGAVDAIAQELDSLVEDVFKAVPKFEQVLQSAFVSHDEKEELLDKTLKGKASPTMLNFLKVLAKHERLDLLRSIHREFRDEYERWRGRVPITVTTAAPIEPTELEALAKSLDAFVQGDAVVDWKVDPELVGGMVVRVGDTLYDASVATQLKNVRQQMIDRSANEIQSRRDRFRNPTGN